MVNKTKKLILASTSPWRIDMLKRLKIPFVAMAPPLKESSLAGEKPKAKALRLARLKAESVSAMHPEAVVIGADQVCCCQDQIYSKPGTIKRATAQLTKFSGKKVYFYSAVCIISPTHSLRGCSTDIVQFKSLSPKTIAHYLKQEPDAIQCAGACRGEGLGISLCQSIRSHDPTALVGLPLILVIDLLAKIGIDALKP